MNKILLIILLIFQVTAAVQPDPNQWTVVKTTNKIFLLTVSTFVQNMMDQYP
jgi:hypothetical protein